MLLKICRNVYIIKYTHSKMAPGVDLNIPKNIWRDYKIFIARLNKKRGNDELSASKRISELMKKDMEETNID